MNKKILPEQEQKKIQWEEIDSFRKYIDVDSKQTNRVNWTYAVCHLGSRLLREKTAEAVARLLGATRIANNGNEKIYRMWDESDNMTANVVVDDVKIVFTGKSLDDSLGIKWGEEGYSAKRDKKRLWLESNILNKYNSNPIDGSYKISRRGLEISSTIDKLLLTASKMAKEAKSDVVVVWGIDCYFLKTGLHMNFYKK